MTHTAGPPCCGDRLSIHGNDATTAAQPSPEFARNGTGCLKVRSRSRHSIGAADGSSLIISPRTRPWRAAKSEVAR